MKIQVVSILILSSLFSNQASFAFETPRFSRPVPKDVLVGTNVEPVDRYFKSIEHFLGPADFSTDTGGASLTVNIVKKGKVFLISRISQVPGEPKQSKQYKDITLKNDGTWLTGKGIEAVKVHGGALILEYHSGVEGIPDNMWFFYGNP